MLSSLPPIFNRRLLKRAPRNMQLIAQHYFPRSLATTEVLNTHINFTDRKQARCWAPRIYYAIGEQFRASSVDYFLPHVKMIDTNNRLLQYHCNPYNLRAAKKGYLTTRTPLHSATSTLPFFRGQNPRYSHAYN